MPDPSRPQLTTNPEPLIPNPCLYACLYHAPGGDQPASGANTLVRIAEVFSPRYERHHEDLVSIDVSGLERLLGPARTIGEELRREAVARGVRVHVAVAGTRVAASVLARACPGVTIVERGGEADALAAIPIGILEKIDDERPPRPRSPQRHVDPKNFAALAAFAVDVLKRWGVKTLGELAALPTADLVARLGASARLWQAIARGEDVRPLVPTLPDERFQSMLELEWPIEGLEPLSFVLTRLLEPVSTRLERRDRGAAVLHVILGLVTRDSYARRLELPSPMRDVRTLRTLALLDLEAHPPPAAIDRVTIVIDPTPGRVLQHTLFTRAQPTPEQLSTLVARLGALMGQDRFGAPAIVDSYRPGAFAIWPFATSHDDHRKDRHDRKENLQSSRLRSPQEQASVGVACQSAEGATVTALSHQPLISAIRRCRHPVPARVAVVDDRPVRVTTDRLHPTAHGPRGGGPGRGFAGGSVSRVVGPWRSSGNWWSGGTYPTHQTDPTSWDRDEWDVSLNDGGVYRIFRDRDTDAWFIDAIVD